MMGKTIKINIDLFMVKVVLGGLLNTQATLFYFQIHKNKKAPLKNKGRPPYLP
jgi:hypothetical protein